MSIMEKQIVFIMLTVGIVGGLSYYVWYRRKRLQPLSNSRSNSIENSVEPRVDTMADANKQNKHSEDDYDAAKDEEDLSAKLGLQKNSESSESHENFADDDNSTRSADNNTMLIKKPVGKRFVSNSRHQLAIYVPPSARATSPEEVLTYKQPHPPMLNAHCKKKSSSLPTTPSEKASGNRQPHPSTSPVAIEYIVTITIPLWLVSRFIGKQGCGVKSLSQLSGAEFRVLRHPVSNCSHTLCNIIGSKTQIGTALDLIGRRFPEVTVPNYSNMKLFHGSRHKPATISKKQHPVCNGITQAVIPATKFFASVSHIESLSSVWLHVVNSSAPCPWQELYERMNSTYNFASACGEYSKDEGVPVNQFYAVRTEEGDFARGLVKEVVNSSIHNDDKVYKVMLVDRGNHINVTSDKLVPLRCVCRIMCV